MVVLPTRHPVICAPGTPTTADQEGQEGSANPECELDYLVFFQRHSMLLDENVVGVTYLRG